MRKSFAAIVAASWLLTLLAAPASATNAAVHIVDGAPDPAQLTVNDGDTVTFFNDDDVAHTIFAAGQARGAPIAPHTGAEFGPFETGGEHGTFAYQVDQGGAPGTIIVSGPAPSTTESTSTTGTTTIAPSTTTTTTTSTTSTTASTTSTTVAAGIGAISIIPGTPKKESSNLVVAIGFGLLVAGIAVLVIAMGRARRRPRTDW